MVVVGTGSSGTRFLNTDYPFEEGLTLGTTKQTEESTLNAEEANLISSSELVGL